MARAEVLGRGRLAGAIRAAVPGAAGGPDPVGLLVVATDGWDASGYPDARQRAGGQVPWLPVRPELGELIIGPMEEPDRAGCVDCADYRRRCARADGTAWSALRRQHGARLASRPSPLLTSQAVQVVVALVVDEWRRLEASGPRTRGALLRVDLAELSVTLHRFLPNPACPVCGTLPDDTAEQARIELSSQPAHRPGAYRTRDLSGELDRLRATYVDEEVGVVRSLATWSEGALVLAAAPVRMRLGQQEAGYGRTGSLPASRLTALLEALERYGSAPGGRRTVVEASYQELGARALDPRTVGLHEPAQYGEEGFPHQPFAPDRRHRWVWGWSFARQEAVLVPELLAYYSVPDLDGGLGFVADTSNGCALGSCLEEAILYGILEVAERDAFLLTWYARLAATRIDLTTADDEAVPLVAAAIRAETGYRTLAFDTTVEHGIPCVWAMAVNPRDDGRPALICAAGSHPDPQRAVANALAELGPGLAALIRRYTGAEVARARRLAEEPRHVATMADHALLYADPGAARRLDFLTGADRPEAGVRKVAEVGRAERGGFASDDLRDNVREAIARFTSRGMDVIVVDQTAPEHRAGGLVCAKVLIPGMLPMSFGRGRQRLVGLRRLNEVPALLGYRARPLRADEVNPHPHPFP